MRFNRTVFLITWLALFGAARLVAAAEVQYRVTVDTSSQNSNSGYIDFQFNPSAFGSQAANADVDSFQMIGGGTPNPAAPGNGTSGEVSGVLPLTVSLINSESTNEYTEGMIFGNTITFDLGLYGPALDAPNGEGGGTFTLDFLDNNGNYLFTDDPQNDVPVLTVTINGDGSTTATTYASGNNGPPVVTFSGPTLVPEPSSVLLLSGGLLALVVLHRRRIWTC
jgi:hypothetical protein